MVPQHPGSRLARYALYALVVLALAMVSTVAYVLITGDERERITNDADPSPPLPEFNSPPTLVFPERLRTYDSSLNRFIDHFIRATLEGHYNDFRQMWTRRLDPVSSEKYLRIWKVVREVRVVDVRPLRKADGTIEAYLIGAEVKQDPGSVAP